MRYNLFGVGQKGKSPNVTAQRRMNLYMDVQPQEDKTLYSYHPTPGLTLFAAFGDSPIRGMHKVGTLMYVVHRATLWEIDNAGTKTSRGTLNTSEGRVDMADNQNGIIMITDGTNGYLYTISSTTLTEITDADYNDNSETVTYHDGYFITPKKDTAEFYLSDADVTNATNGWDALEFATAEKGPDDLVRVFDNNTDILLCGDETIEFWNNTGEGSPPYQRVTGGVIELGLAAKWSISKFAESSVVLLANNSNQGEVSVIRIDGFQYVTISNPEFATVINGYTTVSDASGFSYTKEGHNFYQLNFPTEGKSWLYDGATNIWSELTYGANEARHRAEMAVNFLNKMYVADYENGNVYRLDSEVYADNGEPIVREIVSKHIFDEKDLPISRVWLDIESGVGLESGQGVNPQMVMQVSRDGGNSWGNEKFASMGKIGEYKKRLIWRRLGRSYDWAFRFRCSDPVKTVIIGAWVDAAG